MNTPHSDEPQTDYESEILENEGASCGFSTPLLVFVATLSLSITVLSHMYLAKKAMPNYYPVVISLGVFTVITLITFLSSADLKDKLERNVVYWSIFWTCMGSIIGSAVYYFALWAFAHYGVQL